MKERERARERERAKESDINQMRNEHESVCVCVCVWERERKRAKCTTWETGSLKRVNQNDWIKRNTIIIKKWWICCHWDFQDWVKISDWGGKSEMKSFSIPAQRKKKRMLTLFKRKLFLLPRKAFGRKYFWARRLTFQFSLCYKNPLRNFFKVWC